MKKLALVRKYYKLSGTETSVRILRKVFTRKFIRRFVQIDFDKKEFGKESIVVFMTKRNPVITSQELIDYVWNIASHSLKEAMLVIRCSPSIELLDRDWNLIKSKGQLDAKAIFQSNTGYLPYEERLENKNW